MATWDDVRRLALALPEVVERDGGRDWRIRGKGFANERPLRKADLEALGDAAPAGPVLGVRVADVGVKAALIAGAPDVYFTTPHFDGWPAVLVRLGEIAVPELAELLEEAWLVQAPKRLAAAYLEAHPGVAGPG
jgi:hypothetical protein